MSVVGTTGTATYPPANAAREPEPIEQAQNNVQIAIDALEPLAVPFVTMDGLDMALRFSTAISLRRLADQAVLTRSAVAELNARLGQQLSGIETAVRHLGAGNFMLTANVVKQP